jgi:hypothetical protein
LNLKHDILDRKIKLIWDFRGPEGFRTAEHHEKHLKEFIAMEKLPLDITGHEQMNEMHSLAYMVVNEKDMITVRDTLKPHRGELYIAN